MNAQALKYAFSPLREYEGILGCAKKAAQAKKNNPAVINATIGVLKVNQEVAALPTLQEALLAMVQKKGSHAYPGLYGVFGEAAVRSELWQLAIGPKNQIELETLNRKFHSISTIGGTNAIFLAFKLARSQRILIGWPYWLNYDNIAEFAGKTVQRFELFKTSEQGYCLNIESLIQEAESLLKTDTSLTILLNDPSSNPAGLSLDANDYEKLCKYFNELADRNINVNLIIDPAYSAYDPRGVEGSNQESLLQVLKRAPGVTVFYTWSATKQYLEYNNRSGALMIWEPENTTLQDSEGNTLKEYMAAIVRGTYSQPPSRTDHALLHVLRQGLMPQVDTERAQLVKLLQERSVEAMACAQELQVPIVCRPDGKHPGGFMAYTPCADATQVAEKLEIEGIHVVPCEDHGLRIALSGLDLHEIKPLYQTLSKILHV